MIDWPQILQTHGPAVWRTVYHLVGDVDAAHDCYQETFVAALEESRRRTVDNWAGFLKTLATRRAIDHLRQRYRMRVHTAPAVNLERQADNGREVGLELENSEIREQVRRLLTELAPRQAEAFWMRHMLGMEVQEIAKHLKTPPANVSVLINRACARLREAMTRTPTTITNQR